MKKILSLLLSLLMLLTALPALAQETLTAPQVLSEVWGMLENASRKGVTASLSFGEETRAASFSPKEKAVRLVCPQGEFFLTKEGLLFEMEGQVRLAPWEEIGKAAMTAVTGVSGEDIGQLKALLPTVFGELRAALPMEEILQQGEGTLVLDVPLLASSLKEALPAVLTAHEAELERILPLLEDLGEEAGIRLPSTVPELKAKLEAVPAPVEALGGITGKITLSKQKTEKGFVLSASCETGIFEGTLEYGSGEACLKVTAIGNTAELKGSLGAGRFEMSAALNDSLLLRVEGVSTELLKILNIHTPDEEVALSLSTLENGWELTVLENGGELLNAALTGGGDLWELHATLSGEEELVARLNGEQSPYLLTWTKGENSGEASLTLEENMIELLVTQNGAELLTVSLFLRDGGFTLYAFTPAHILFAELINGKEAARFELTWDGRSLADAHLAVNKAGDFTLSGTFFGNLMSVTLNGEPAALSLCWNDHTLLLRTKEEKDSQALRFSMDDSLLEAVRGKDGSLDLTLKAPGEKLSALEIHHHPGTTTLYAFAEYLSERWELQGRADSLVLSRLSGRTRTEYRLEERPAPEDALNLLCFTETDVTGVWPDETRVDRRLTELTTRRAENGGLILTARDGLTAADLFTLTFSPAADWKKPADPTLITAEELTLSVEKESGK